MARNDERSEEKTEKQRKTHLLRTYLGLHERQDKWQRIRMKVCGRVPPVIAFYIWKQIDTVLNHLMR
jgi:hypothetical protein